MTDNTPRILIAGLRGDGGKTLVALGVVAAFARSRRVAAFKKGPDYIDAAWLGRAAQTSCTNLDTYLMDADTVKAAFARRCAGRELAVIEGNRGLFDGVTATGEHSSAELAKLLKTPVLLVVDATKATRTLAALVLGCKLMDPDVPFAGVVLNKVAGARHARVAREAIETITGLPVLGTIPKLDGAHRIPGRHLGLVPVDEYDDLDGALGYAADVVQEHVDLEAIWARMQGCEAFDAPQLSWPAEPGAAVRIGVMRDGAFSFYYPENLEALEAAGAELVPVHSMHDSALPEIDALYIGGGFPETHAARLTGNADLRKSIADAAATGLPIFAECGGLMYLSRAIHYNDERHEMCGVFPVDVRMHAKPRGHGYVRLVITDETPFAEAGTVVKGHEFHYSSLADGLLEEIATCARVERGTGIGQGRDAMLTNNVQAQYTHVHALSSPQWAAGMVRAARRFKARWDCGRSEVGTGDSRCCTI